MIIRVHLWQVGDSDFGVYFVINNNKAIYKSEVLKKDFLINDAKAKFGNDLIYKSHVKVIKCL